MMSSHHGLYAQGYTRATMAGTTGREAVKRSQSYKAGLSSDWSLELDSMKVESLVIAHQPWLDGRCVQGPGTYSPRHGSRGYLKMVTETPTLELVAVK